MVHSSQFIFAISEQQALFHRSFGSTRLRVYSLHLVWFPVRFDPMSRETVDWTLTVASSSLLPASWNAKEKVLIDENPPYVIVCFNWSFCEKNHCWPRCRTYTRRKKKKIIKHTKNVGVRRIRILKVNFHFLRFPSVSRGSSQAGVRRRHRSPLTAGLRPPLAATYRARPARTLYVTQGFHDWISVFTIINVVNIKYKCIFCLSKRWDGYLQTTKIGASVNGPVLPFTRARIDL